jgi:hypothetical protein
MTAWLWVSGIAAVLGVVTWGLARASSREMPPHPEPETAPWEPDPSRFARCPGCGTLRPTVDGLVAGHDRPDPWVPFDQQSTPCEGAGQPADSGDRGTRTPDGTPVAGQGLRGDAPTSGSG